MSVPYSSAADLLDAFSTSITYINVAEARAQVCDKNLPHAFVLGSSVEGAYQVAKWFHLDKPLVAATL